MVDVIRGAIARGVEPPRFRLPASSILIIAPLSAIAPRICANAAAREVCRLACAVDPRSEREPTVAMLRIALDCLAPGAIEIETVSFAELGLALVKECPDGR